MSVRSVRTCSSRANDPTLWQTVTEAEGIAQTCYDQNEHWLVGATEITGDDLFAARSGQPITEATFLEAAENRFEADGGLVGDWERRQERWSMILDDPGTALSPIGSARHRPRAPAPTRVGPDQQRQIAGAGSDRW